MSNLDATQHATQRSDVCQLDVVTTVVLVVCLLVPRAADADERTRTLQRDRHGNQFFTRLRVSVITPTAVVRTLL